MRVRLCCPPELEGILPPPVPARAALPDWLRSLPATAAEPGFEAPLRSIKQCPPFLDALSTGFLMPLAADLQVGEEGLSWDWSPPQGADGALSGYSRSPISFHFPAQAAGVPWAGEDRLVIKFNSFWTIGLPPGWSLLVTHPLNREELPFRTLSGVVYADRFADAFIHFPALWVDPGFRGVLPKGTPVAQCLPLPRETLELDFGRIEGEAAQRFLEVQEALEREPGLYRKRYRDRRD